MQKTTSWFAKKQARLRGFTFIEVVVIVAIISLLSSGFYLSIKTSLNRAHDTQRKEDIKALNQALALYHQDNLQYPPPTSNPAIEYVSDGSLDWIPGLKPYLTAIPNDPKQSNAGMLAVLFQKTTNMFIVDSKVTVKAKGEVSGISSTNFGSTSVGSFVDSSANNSYDGSRFTMGKDGGTATSISVYVSNPLDHNPNNKYQLVIYSDNAGSPGTLIAKTTQGTLAGNAWNTLPITATLAPNTIYWLMYNTNSTLDADNNLNYNNGNNGDGGYFATSFGTFPTNPVSTLEARVYSIYLTYTPNPYISLTGSSSCSGSNSIVNLSWTTNASYTVYNIIRDGTPITSTTSTSWNSGPNSDQGVSHTWQIQGDPASAGAYSNIVNVTNATCTSIQITLTGSSICSGTNSIVHLSWTTNTGDTQFNIDKDGPAITSVIGTSWDSIPNTDIGVSHNWQVWGTTSGIYSNTVNITNVSCISPCQNHTFVYCYVTTSDRSTYTLWAQLENTNDPDINTKPSAKCTLASPASTSFNYCVQSPIK